jgi:hypothetical protein
MNAAFFPPRHRPVYKAIQSFRKDVVGEIIWNRKRKWILNVHVAFIIVIVEFCKMEKQNLCVTWRDRLVA